MNQRLITLREVDGRHPADLERMRADQADEIGALRQELARLRTLVRVLSTDAQDMRRIYVTGRAG